MQKWFYNIVLIAIAIVSLGCSDTSSETQRVTPNKNIEISEKFEDEIGTWFEHYVAYKYLDWTKPEALLISKDEQEHFAFLNKAEDENGKISSAILTCLPIVTDEVLLSNESCQNKIIKLGIEHPISKLINGTEITTSLLDELSLKSPRLNNLLEIAEFKNDPDKLVPRLEIAIKDGFAQSVSEKWEAYLPYYSMGQANLFTAFQDDRKAMREHSLNQFLRFSESLKLEKYDNIRVIKTESLRSAFLDLNVLLMLEEKKDYLSLIALLQTQKQLFSDDSVNLDKRIEKFEKELVMEKETERLNQKFAETFGGRISELQELKNQVAEKRSETILDPEEFEIVESEMFETIYVEFEGSGGASTSDLKVELDRKFGNFDGNGRGRRISIFKPFSGDISGNYGYKLSTKANKKFFDDMKPLSCSGEFTVSGYKQYITISINEHCDGQIY